MSHANAHSAEISDQNEALRRENADLYAQIKALSQRLAQGSAGGSDFIFLESRCICARLVGALSDSDPLVCVLKFLAIMRDLYIPRCRFQSAWCLWSPFHVYTFVNLCRGSLPGAWHVDGVQRLV